MTHSLCQQMSIDDEEIRARLRFLDFTESDQHHLDEIHQVVEEDSQGIIDEFYAHLLRFEPIADFLAHSGMHEKLKETQRGYLLTLGQHAERLDYFEDRLRIGVAHERIGLEQKWYLGAYSILFGVMARRLARRHLDSPEILADRLVTLQKILTLDACLAVETYYQATMRRLEDLLRQLTEAQKNLQDAARLDGLTRINNRMHLMECLEKELQRSVRFHRSFTLLFLDVDHFKSINDRFGHTAGDSVLKQVVQSLCSVIRPVDLIGRFGGEEFLVGLVETDEATARQVAERLRLKIAHTPFRIDNASVALTISIGVASLGSPPEGLEALIDRADRALYQAKDAGRDQVRVFAQAPLEPLHKFAAK